MCECYKMVQGGVHEKTLKVVTEASDTLSDYCDMYMQSSCKLHSCITNND